MDKILIEIHIYQPGRMSWSQHTTVLWVGRVNLWSKRTKRNKRWTKLEQEDNYYHDKNVPTYMFSDGPSQKAIHLFL